MADLLAHCAAIVCVCASYGVIGAGFVRACDRYDPTGNPGFNLLKVLVASLWPVGIFAALVIAYNNRPRPTTEGGETT
jgi:hypothetical protein